MGWIPDRYRELRDLARRRSVARDVGEEFDAHLAMRIDELIASGTPPEIARREAERRFGDVDVYRAQTESIDKRVQRKHRRAESHDAFGRELRLALTSLRRSPGFAVVAALTLALGIGATVGIFSVLEGIVLRPLPFPEPERLVRVTHPVPGMGAGAEWAVSAAGYHHFLRSPSFESLGAFTSGEGAVFRDGDAERVRLATVSAAFFDVLRQRPAAGRFFTVRETEPGATPVIVLSHGYWQRAFGSDPTVVGTMLEVGGMRYEIVGVASPETQYPGIPIDLWFPIELDPKAPAQNAHWLTVIGRLRPGVSAAAAERDLAAQVRAFSETYPSAYAPAFMRETGFGVAVRSWRDDIVGTMARTLWIGFGAVAVVLLIAAANVVNLVLVRAETRRREIAVRRALGAERKHLAWHFLSEGMALAGIAGVLGVAIAWGALKLAVARIPLEVPRLAEVQLGRAGLGFALFLVMLAGVAFGVAPLWQDRAGLDGLREGGRGSASTGRGRRRTRNVLVVAQVALSLILLASAGLLVRSAAALRRVELGFRPERTLTFSVSLPWGRYKTYESYASFHRELAQHLAALPGVVRVGAGGAVPLGGNWGCAGLWVEGRPVPPGEVAPCLANPQVSPGYFEALGIPVRGRARTWDDEHVRSDGVVVSEALARRLWPGEDAIGKGIRGAGDGPPFYHVIGVAGNVPGKALDEPPVEATYFPMQPIEGAPLWQGARRLTVIVRTSSDAPPSALVPAIRRVLHELDPRIPLGDVRSMSALVDDATARTRFIMALLAAAAAMALLLSAVGMYGVISHLVGQRRGEIGVRMALGARAAQVRTMVVGESLLLAGGGVVLGVAGAFATTRLLGSLLVGVTPSDPLTLGAVTLVLLGVVVAASYLPARRASRIDPVEALRAD